MWSSKMIWENKETFGAEYLTVVSKKNNILVESTVIYLAPGLPVQIDYQLELDSSWKTKKVDIQNRKGESLQLTSTGDGKWFDRDGKRMEELNGAIDVDISVTPFSNSLPINRYDWKPLQVREFEMVYISIPTLEVQKVKQTYTYVETKNRIRAFNYQCRNFESLILVDEQGFVVEYPQLFTRRF